MLNRIERAAVVVLSPPQIKRKGVIGMKATREEQKAEALRRLDKWNTDGFIRLAFEQGQLAVCEKFDGLIPGQFIVLASELPTDILTEIREKEEEYGILAYMVIKSTTVFGVLYDILYVSENKEDWAMDAELMEDNVVMSYCINSTEPLFSEFGTIMLESTIGGLHRIQ